MSGARTETFVRGAAILLNVFMPAVLVGEAAQESFAGHRACDVSNTVLAALGQTCTEQLQSSRRSGRAANSLFTIFSTYVVEDTEFLANIFT